MNRQRRMDTCVYKNRYSGYAAPVRAAFARAGQTRCDTLSCGQSPAACSDRAGSKVGELSGGMVRRLGIAQTLLNEPQLLIFDEPTAGLDPEERVRFQNIITNIKKDRTVILSTHIVADIQAVCDEVLMLGEGKLLFHGTVRDMTEQARDKVFLARQADMTGSEVFIVKTEEKDGEVTLRYLAPENRGGSPCEPTAEDGYLCIQKQI